MTHSKKILAAFVVGSVVGGYASAGNTAVDNMHGARSMTKKWCRQQATQKGVTDVSAFNTEVKKCVADPTAYK